MSSPINDVKDVPKQEHFGILVFKSSSQYVPANGHGYPSYYETVKTTEYYAFNTQDELTEFLLNNNFIRSYPYQVVFVKPITIQKTIKLKYE